MGTRQIAGKSSTTISIHIIHTWSYIKSLGIFILSLKLNNAFPFSKPYWPIRWYKLMEIIWFIILCLSFICLTIYCYYQIMKKTFLKKEDTPVIPNKKLSPPIYSHPLNQRYNVNRIRKSNYVVFYDPDQDRNTLFKSIKDSEIMPQTIKKEKKELFPFDLLIVKPITPKKQNALSKDKISFLWIVTCISLAIVLGLISGLLLYHVWDFLCSLTS